MFGGGILIQEVLPDTGIDGRKLFCGFVNKDLGLFVLHEGVGQGLWCLGVRLHCAQLSFDQHCSTLSIR